MRMREGKSQGVGRTRTNIHADGLRVARGLTKRKASP